VAKPTELPEQPTLMWRQERYSWVAVTLLLAIPFLPDLPTGQERTVKVSVNGLTVDGRFVPWRLIADVRGARSPSLATIVMTDGTRLVLDRYHLPKDDDGTVQAARRELLRHAFELSRASAGAAVPPHAV